MAVEVRAEHRQHGYRVRLEWGRPGVELLAAECAVVVVVDVLSFSTSVDIAVGRGARVLPQRHDDPAAAAAEADRIGALRAGPRGGPGPSLRPSSLLGLDAGTTLALPSPNGATLCAAAAGSGAVVLVGCLRNAAAVATAAIRLAPAHDAGVHGGGCAVPPGPDGGFHDAERRAGAIGLVAGGERWPDGTMRVAVEDAVGAGAVAAHLSALLGGTALSPEADLAAAQFAAAHTRGLHEFLTATASGRELVADGYAVDVELAAALDAGRTVPRLRAGILVQDEEPSMSP